MKRTLAIAVLGWLAMSCGQKPDENHCTSCTVGVGAVAIGFELTSADVVRIVATVSATDIATAISGDLTISGTTASGTITTIPAGTGRTITVSAYPAIATDPEGAVVIYGGQTTVDIVAGQVANASLTLFPVLGDVAVSAAFPSGDTDVARIDHIAVVVTGNRIESPETFYLQFGAIAGTASGTAQKIPVGLTRTVTVSSFAADGTLLHQGAATIAVAQTGSSAAVTMSNLTGGGNASVSAGFCTPACGASVCGDDGCGGSCGGCMPGQSCNAGQCSFGPCTFTTNSACGATSCCQSDPTHEQVCCSKTATLVSRYCTGAGICPGGGTYPNCVGAASCPPDSSSTLNTNGSYGCSNQCGAVGPGGCAVCQSTAYVTSCSVSWSGSACQVSVQ